MIFIVHYLSLAVRHLLSASASYRVSFPHRVSSDEGLTLETSAVKLFSVANSRYQVSW